MIRPPNSPTLPALLLEGVKELDGFTRAKLYVAWLGFLLWLAPEGVLADLGGDE